MAEINDRDMARLVDMIASSGMRSVYEATNQPLGVFQAPFPNYTVIDMPNQLGSEGYNLGYVNMARPNETFIDPAGLLSVPQIAAHEFEHQLEGKAMARYGKGTTPVETFFIQNLADLNNKDDLVANAKAFEFIDSLKSPEVKSYIMKNYNIGPTGRIGNKDENRWFELIADMSGIETYTGKDLTQDPYIRENVFNDDDTLIEAYKSVTGLRQDRLDAKDISPYSINR